MKNNLFILICFLAAIFGSFCGTIFGNNQANNQIASQTNNPKIQTNSSSFSSIISASSSNLINNFVSNITKNPKIDNYIEKLAIERGYKLQKENIQNLVEIDGQKLSPKAKSVFEKLKIEAKKENLDMILVSGFRSISDQQKLFLRDYNTKQFDENQVIAGEADKYIDNILSTRSIPNYSKHHTGNTIDLGCGDKNLLNFKNTKCFEWLSKNNYANAKAVGLEPSYPKNGGKMGPDPEEWEYIVALDNL
jgi:LAS superfamily LD-carboxypeptidase LdcB